MKKLLLVAIVAGGLVCAGATRSNTQVYFSIGFGPGYYGTRDLIIDHITDRTTGTASIVIIAIIILIITGASLIGLATLGWLAAI